MTNIQNTIQEIFTIIQELKAKCDNKNAWTDTADKDQWEKRLKHVQDRKTNPKHPSGPDLKFDKTELEALETVFKDAETIATEKAQLQSEKKEAETKAHQAQTEKTAELTKKQAELDQVKKAIADKLTADLITKLEKVADATPTDQTQQLTDIKSVIDEIKTKGTQADLSDAMTKLDQLAIKTDEIKNQANQPSGTSFWAIGGFVAGVISVFLLGYIAFLKPRQE